MAKKADSANLFKRKVVLLYIEIVNNHNEDNNMGLFFTKMETKGYAKKVAD